MTAGCNRQALVLATDVYGTRTWMRERGSCDVLVETEHADTEDDIRAMVFSLLISRLG